MRKQSGWLNIVYAAEQSDQPDIMMEEDTALPLTQCPDKLKRQGSLRTLGCI